jgi:8-oxo-dGTP diphosphatase
MTFPKPIDVAVGVVRDSRGNILIAQRSSETHLGGLWEFPGGKVEGDETYPEALARELEEELGIRIQNARHFLEVSHQYPKMQVRLHIYEVHQFKGEPVGREGQPIRWVSPAQLKAFPFPKANYPIITRLALGELYAIIDEPLSSGQKILDQLLSLISRGVRLIRLRAPLSGLSSERGQIEGFIRLCRERGVVLLLSGSPELVRAYGASGIHLTSAQLMMLNSRPLESEFWVGASCHEMVEIQHSQGIGIDFAVLSPIKETKTHPNANPLGWKAFKKMAESAIIPVFALGGLSPADLAEAKDNGAQGIAAIRGLCQQRIDGAT